MGVKNDNVYAGEGLSTWVNITSNLSKLHSIRWRLMEPDPYDDNDHINIEHIHTVPEKNKVDILHTMEMN